MIRNGRDPEALAEAAQALARGELVGVPTETVYGLGARADQDEAVAKIFAAKGRPADHPLIVHVTDPAQAALFADGELPAMARQLMDAFWPGPLTVIVPRAPAMAAAAAGGQSSVGLRCPSHPVAHALLVEAHKLGVPGMAAPSANRFGRVSPTHAEHVAEEFGPDLLVLDGGDCEVGIESTIVDCSRGRAVLLRPGMITPEQLEAVLGQPVQSPDAGAPRASGTLEAHYAPRAVVRLFGDAAALSEQLGKQSGQGVAVYSRSPAVQTAGASPLTRRMPQEPQAAAHELFAVLRELDAAGAEEIWIEAPPAGSAWDGVRDRLNRAAAAFVGH